MAAYQCILTTLGLAKIAVALSTSTPLNLTTGKVGDGNGNPTNPQASDTALVHSVYSAALNSVFADPVVSGRIFAELVIPASSGGWTVREIGIFDADGDMIAVAQYPAVYKPLASEGATKDLVVRMVLQVSNTAAINLTVDTSVVVATRSWTDGNYKIAAQIPGGTTNQLLAKSSNADGAFKWVDPAGTSVIVEIIEENQTASAGQTVITLATCTTESASIYINGVRLRQNQWTATNAAHATLSTALSSGDKITIVQNDPTGASDFLHASQNLNDLPDKATARGNLGLLTDDTYLTALWKLMNQKQYPVGEIWMTRQTGNPADLLGFGTWVAYGQGRALVGYDSGDSAFNAVDKTGGEKTHTLTVAEMPSHNHDLQLGNGSTTIGVGMNSNGNIPYTDSVHIQNKGGDQPHNNLQPYITIFLWKRTA